MNRFKACMLIAFIIFMFTNNISSFAVVDNTIEQTYVTDIQHNKTPMELIIKGKILNELQNQKSVIDVQDYDLNEKKANMLLKEMIAENSSVINTEIKYDLVVKAGTVSYINITYPKKSIMLMDMNKNTDTDAEKITEEIKNVLACVNDSMTDLQKALAVHDYFVLNYEYDYTYSNYTAEEMFLEKKGVCSAYTLAYIFIMQNMLGIPCEYVSSNAMNHAWNLIKIDGEWYNIDCTWDDDYRCRHLHFMVSDMAMADSERNHYSWNSPYPATSTKYDNYFWKYVDSKIILIDEYYYYMTSNGDISKRNVTSGMTNTIYSINSFWPCYNNPGSFWKGCFSGLEYYNGRIYANTSSKIISMDLSGDNLKTLVNQDVNKGYIYGFILKSDSIIYDISRDIYEFEIESQKNLSVKDAESQLGIRWILENGVLTISGNGYMENYLPSLPAPWDSSAVDISSVVIEDGVKSIGEYAFYNCSNLLNIYIPKGVISIGAYAFSNCNKLSFVSFPKSLKSIGRYAFYSCSKLSNAVIPDSVTSINQGAFAYCNNLVSVNIPYGVKNIADDVFYNCSNLTHITIPEGTVSIGLASFQGCSSLKTITIPKSVTNINYSAFAYCNSLKNVYYTGDESKWASVKIGNKNECLTNSNINYNVDYAGEDFAVSNVVIGENSFSANLNINEDVVAQPAIAIIAFYDKNGKLVQFGSDNINIMQGEVEVNIPIENKEYSTYKLMLWDGFEKIKPILK